MNVPVKRSARMRTDSFRNMSAKADPNPARKTRKRVLTILGMSISILHIK